MHWRRRLKRKVLSYRPIRKTAYFFAVISLVCLLYGIVINPAINNPNQGNSLTKDFKQFTGLKELNCPNPLWNSTLPLTLYYNMTSENFTQNQPVEINLFLRYDFDSRSEMSNLDFNMVRVNVLNAINNDSNVYAYGIPATFLLQNTYNETYSGVTLIRFWVGNQTVRFQATGTPQLEIQLSVVFAQDARRMVDQMFTEQGSNVTNGKEYAYMQQWQPFKETITIPPINIESSKVAELENEQQEQARNQKTSEKTSESLTYVVLFFASLDIAVVLYDHSDEKENKPTYKNGRKNYNNTNHWKMENRAE
jgi:hypothetical protein